jgi:uncharacterized membrane protein
MQRHPAQKAAASRRATRSIGQGAFWLLGGFVVHQLVVPRLSYAQPMEWAMWGAMALGAYMVVMGTVAYLWTSAR